VEKASNDDLPVVDYEIDGVRETTEQATPEFIVNFRIKEGIPVNIAGTGIKHPRNSSPRPDDFVSYHE
jgi:hypothetical protein